MPWRESTAVSQRLEFVVLASLAGANISELCRQFGVTRRTGYKWLARADSDDPYLLADRSRRPLLSPGLTPVEVVAAVRAMREENPAWGGRKIRRVLQNETSLLVPAASTITEILRREGLLEARPEPSPVVWQRFQEEAPNDLWQIDFKGPVSLASGGVQALGILDDHSRFNLCLAACSDQRRETVQSQLVRVFERYGLPLRMLMDNGPPWGSAGQTPSGSSQTRLSAWLIRRGISVSHGRPYHPQTQGKEERFNRTLIDEVLSRTTAYDRYELQLAFDRWREVYNFRRPHESLNLDTPGSRYTPSPRALPVTLPPIDYQSTDDVLRVRATGRIRFRGQDFPVSKGLAGEPVALRASGDGTWDIYYCHQKVGNIDLSCTEDL